MIPQSLGLCLVSILPLGACTFPTDMKFESAAAKNDDTMIIEVSTSDDWMGLSRGFWGGEPYLVAAICESDSHRTPEYVEGEAFTKNGRRHFQMTMRRDLEELGRSDPLPGGGWVGVLGWPRDLITKNGVCVQFTINGIGSGYRSPIIRAPEIEALLR